jgi:hypothetical protein
MAAKDGGNHGRPSRRRWVEPGASPRISLRRKAEELMRDAGLPQHLAMRVAREEISLKDALTEVVDKDRLDRLVSRHGLDRSLATQVLMGRVSLDQILQRRRMKEHIDANHDRSTLDVALADGQPRVYGLHGQRLVRAKLVELNPYELTLVAEDGDAPAGPLGLIHKLQVKFVASETDIDKVRRAIKHKVDHVTLEPITRPQDRYRCANKRLFAWHDAKAPIEFTTLEGDLVVGPLNWIGRWELGVGAAEEMELILFRHALANISGGVWGSTKEG